MEIVAKTYEKIAILQVSGLLSESDLQDLITELPKSCRKFSTVILILANAKVQDSAAAPLIAFRDSLINQKPNLVLVSPDFPDADQKDLVAALDHIGTLESERILQIYERGHELSKLRNELIEVNRQAHAIVKVPDDAEDSVFELAVARARDENHKLKHLLKVLGAEIEALKKQRVFAGGAAKINPEAQKRIDDARKKAFAALKAAGVTG